MKKIIIIFLITIFLFSLMFVVIYNNETNKKTFSLKSEIVVEKGETLYKTLGKLGIENSIIQKIFIRLNSYETNIKRGEYIINGEYTFKEILDELVKGQIKYIKFIIPEGFTQNDIKNRFHAKALINKEDFNEALREVDNFPFKIKNNNFEGYFYPETYFFTKDQSGKEMLEMIFDKFLLEYKEILNMKQNNFYDKLILASIIEKETSLSSEKKIVASVFYNRMKIRMKLESCATIEYLYDFKKEKIYYSDLKIDSPFNTYINRGLPPTPICNPSKESMEAAMYPSDSEYLFFVADGNGGHKFSKSYKEHLKNQKK